MAGMFDRLQTEIDKREPAEGLSPADLLMLPDELRRIVQLINRRGGMTTEALAAELELPAPEVETLAGDLVDKGMLTPARIEDQPGYKIRFGHRRRREVPFDIWAALKDRTEAGEPAGEGGAGEGDPAAGDDRGADDPA